MSKIKKLTTKQKCDLRGKAHSLKPIVMIGSSGLTIPVQKEIDHALEDHELIKVRVSANDKEDRKKIIQEICDYNFAELIQTVGHIATIYRTKFNLSPRLKDISIIIRKIIAIASPNTSVDKIYIFGSRAKGDARDVSDIDVAIYCPKIADKEWVEICDKIENINTLLSFDLVRLDTASDDLEKEIRKYGITIYEQH